MTAREPIADLVLESPPLAGQIAETPTLAALGDLTMRTKPRSLWSDAWRRFRKFSNHPQCAATDLQQAFSDCQSYPTN